jgi:serine/threonine-protein kinase
MAFGVAFLLLLAVLGLVVLLALLPKSRILHAAALFLIGLVIALLLPALLNDRSGPSAAWVFSFLFVCGLIVLFLWGIKRWFPSAPPGNRPLPCPPIGRLKDLLAEQLPPREHARLAAHLESCTACQHRVEGLMARQDPSGALAGKLKQPPRDAAPALRQVIDRLKTDRQAEATRDEPAFAGQLPLGFLAPPEKPGQLGRLERYEVLQEIGRGGRGVVLKAFDPSLHRVVAIKMMAPHLASSGVARQRFLREARAAAAVTHDHIVTIHAVEEGAGLPYLVMQLVPGQSLQQRIDKGGAITDLAEILRIGMQAAAGLAAAHSHGIIHRDIKPAKILLEEGVSRVKITDFGLARAMDDASLTQSGLVAGSPQYMAPEQARGEPLNHRADLFSLGSVLYTMCTGRPPFRAANTLAVLRRVSEDDPRPIRETNPEVPDWLAEVVGRLMAKDPAERFQSAAEVVEVLGQHLARLQHGAGVPAPAPNRPAELPTSLTICPSCGAGLHVPERLVGSLVHCGECGKPFCPQPTSEEMVVARAVPAPFGRPAGSRTGRRLLAWALGGCAALGLFTVLLYGLSGSPGTEVAAHAPVKKMADQKTAQPSMPFWKETLERLPPEATLFGAVDLRPFGSLAFGDEWARAALRLGVAAEVADRLTPEHLGRVRIDGVSLAR